MSRRASLRRRRRPVDRSRTRSRARRTITVRPVRTVLAERAPRALCDADVRRPAPRPVADPLHGERAHATAVASADPDASIADGRTGAGVSGAGTMTDSIPGKPTADPGADSPMSRNRGLAQPVRATLAFDRLQDSHDLSAVACRRLRRDSRRSSSAYRSRTPTASTPSRRTACCASRCRRTFRRSAPSVPTSSRAATTSTRPRCWPRRWASSSNWCR